MDEEAKTILYIASRSDIAGGEHYLLNVMHYLERERFVPVFVLPGKGELETALKKLGVETIVLETNYGWLKPPKLWYELMSAIPNRVNYLLELIRDRKVSLVQTTSNMILEGALAAKLTGTPHIYVAQIEYQPNMPVFERFPLTPATFASLMHEMSERMVAVSDAVARTFCPPLTMDQIEVIYNGLDWEKLDAAAQQNAGTVRRELGLPEDAVLVTGVGRVHPDKGFDHLLEAAAAVLQDNSNVRFLLVGADDDGAFADSLRSSVKTSGLADRFLFLGYRKDVPRILSDSDIFVLSSRREGHPFVLLEAMACRCAPIATRCGGAEETVRDNENGYLIDVGDVTNLAARIVELARDPGKRNVIGLRASEYVRQRFDARSTVNRLMAIYDDVLAQPRSSHGSVAVDLFLRCAQEMSSLGLQVTQLQERVRRTEDFVSSIKHSLPLRWARAARQVLQSVTRANL